MLNVLFPIISLQNPYNIPRKYLLIERKHHMFYSVSVNLYENNARRVVTLSRPIQQFVGEFP